MRGSHGPALQPQRLCGLGGGVWAPISWGGHRGQAQQLPAALRTLRLCLCSLTAAHRGHLRPRQDPDRRGRNQLLHRGLALEGPRQHQGTELGLPEPWEGGSLLLGMVLLCQRGQGKPEAPLAPLGAVLGGWGLSWGQVSGCAQGCLVPHRTRPAQPPARPPTGRRSWSSWTLWSSTAA